MKWNFRCTLWAWLTFWTPELKRGIDSQWCFHWWGVKIFDWNFSLWDTCFFTAASFTKPIRVFSLFCFLRRVAYSLNHWRILRRQNDFFCLDNLLKYFTHLNVLGSEDLVVEVIDTQESKSYIPFSAIDFLKHITHDYYIDSHSR